MGERRKRKSLWDMEEDSRFMSGMSEHNSWTGKDRHSSHGSGRYHEFSDPRTTTTRQSRDHEFSDLRTTTTRQSRDHEFSDPRTTTTRQSRDHSDWPPWESFEENSSAPISGSFKNAKEMGGGKRYYQKMSPGFDGMDPHNYNPAREYDRSHYQRGRTRGRSRSRSLSRGRERERERGRGWSRSRSRSRSRSDVNAEDYTRSRSPIADYRRQSHGWSDRRSGPEKSSQICRDFAAGGCRRGSQCRFFHPNSTSRHDGDHAEDDTAENWRSRAEDHSRVLKHSYSRSSGFESRHDVSDSYNEEDDRFLNKGRTKVPCKDFMRGKCRWGETCRFSHHAAASDDSFGQGTRNESFDKDDIDRQPYKSEKPLCKYFAAGKCARDNCRFSHDGPNFNNLEGRRGEITENFSSHDKNIWWNGPTWDDAMRSSDTLKPTGWSIGETGNGQIDDGECHSLENESNRGILEYASTSFNGDKQHSLPRESGSYGGEAGPTESFAEDNMANKQEHLVLQNQERIANVHLQNALLEYQSFSLQQNVYRASHVEQQQHSGVIESNNQMNSFRFDGLEEVKDARYTTHPKVIENNNQMNSFRSDGLEEVKDTGYTTHPILLSGQSLNESERGKNMLCPNTSSGFSTDLNVPEAHIVGPLNVQIQAQNNQAAVQSPAFLEPKAPQFLTNLTSEHSQTYAAIEVPLVNMTNVQLNQDVASLDPFSSNGNGRDEAEHGNHSLALGTELNDQIHPKRLSPLSVVVTEFDSSKVDHAESPRLRQEEVIANSEVSGGNKVNFEESKGVEENNNRSETVDGKVEDGSANKDEKGVRLFKNALVEFVKEILKPTWKEGKMSREVHKTVVKKVVDKVSSTVQVDRIPKTQDKVEQYLSYSKPKITKLVQAYVERCPKADS